MARTASRNCAGSPGELEGNPGKRPLPPPDLERAAAWAGMPRRVDCPGSGRRGGTTRRGSVSVAERRVESDPRCWSELSTVGRGHATEAMADRRLVKLVAEDPALLHDDRPAAPRRWSITRRALVTCGMLAEMGATAGQPRRDGARCSWGLSRLRETIWPGSISHHEDCMQRLAQTRTVTPYARHFTLRTADPYATGCDDSLWSVARSSGNVFLAESDPV